MTQHPAVQAAFQHLRLLGIPVVAVVFSDYEGRDTWTYFQEDGKAPGFPHNASADILQAAMDAVDNVEWPYYERYVHPEESTFYVDWPTADADRLAVDVAGYGSVYISKSADGLMVDIYPFHSTDGPVASCGADLYDLHDYCARHLDKEGGCDCASEGDPE